MSKISPSEQKFIDYCEAYPESKYMLEKLKTRSTKIGYSMGVKYLCDFLKKTPTEIMQEYRTDIKRDMYAGFSKWEKIFSDFTTHLENLGYTGGSLPRFHSGGKKLININVPHSLRLQAESPEVYSKTIRGITKENLKRIYNMCNVKEKFFTAALKDSGISAEDAVCLNLENLVFIEAKGEDLKLTPFLEAFVRKERNRKWIYIELIRKKEHVEYETFLGPDTIEALWAYMSLRQRKGEKLTPETPIFAVNQKPYQRMQKASLATMFWNLRIKTGIVISTHRLRKFFETYMALVVRHPIILKYWMGHKIFKKSRDVEARYIIPPAPEQLKLYKAGYKNINLTSGVIEERVEAIEKIMEEMTPEQRELMQKHGVTMMRKDEEDKPDVETNGAGLGTQKIVTEDQLAEHLTGGWRVIAALPSGNIVIGTA